LGGSDIDWGWGSWCPLENQGAASFAQKGRNPGNQVWGYPAFPQDSGESFVVDVVETCFYVQKQGGDLEAGPLQGSDVVGQGEARVIGAEPRERTALVGVQQSSESAAASRRAAIILSRIFEIVRIRTIILKEEGDS